MIEPDSSLARSIFAETGSRFAYHYQYLSHEASQMLKPELRWKKAARQFWKSRCQLIKEIELNSIALLDQERDNLFNSIEWAHHYCEWKLACQIIDDLATYFNTRSYWSEWMHFAKLAVDDANLAGDPELKAVALNNLSVIHRQVERLSESVQYGQESYNLCQQIGDRYGEGLSLGNLGGTYFAQRNLQASLESYTSAIRVFEKLGELYERSQCLMGIGIVLARQQKLDDACSYFNASIKIQRKITDHFGEAQALNNLGIVRRMQKRFDEAIKSFKESLRIKQEIGDQQGIANSLSNLAAAYENSGQFMLAITCWQKTLTMVRDINPSEAERVARRLAQIRARTKEST